MKYRIRIGLLAIVVLAACDREAQEPAAPAEAESQPAVAGEVSGDSRDSEAATRQITDEYMREILREISGDEYEGRGPGTRGDEKARQYLAARMESLGLEPGGEDGSWEQPFELVGLNSDQPETWTFTGNGQALTVKQWDQYMINSDIQAPRAAVQRPQPGVALNGAAEPAVATARP